MSEPDMAAYLNNLRLDYSGEYQEDAAEPIHVTCGDLRKASEKINWLQDLLRGRDNFIVSSGLWSEFVETLK